MRCAASAKARPACWHSVTTFGATSLLHSCSRRTFAGLAGSLYVYYNRFVSPDYLHVARSAEVLLMVILGGAGTLIGPAIGAALIVLLQNIISGYTERWLIVLGVIYVLVALFAPRGLVGFVRDLRAKRGGA